MVNLVVTDLDGTLLDIDHKPSEFTKKIIKILYDMNINIVFASGRAYDDMKRVTEQIGIDIPLICSNGTVLVNKNEKYIYSINLDKNISNYLIDLDYKAVSKDILINVVTEKNWYVLENIPKNHPLNEWSTCSYSYNIVSKNDIEFDSISKIYYVGYHDDLLKLEKIIKDKLGNSVNIAFTLDTCLEIFPSDATKAIALEKLSKINNYNLTKAVAFGDGFNDVEMLKEVSIPFIMGNAPDRLKALLPDVEVIGYNYENAVANKLVELFDLEV